MKHELKCWPQFFQPLSDCVKTFELRKDDRGFALGDVLHLREWSPVSMKYTTREAVRVIVYILRAPLDTSEPALALDYCILGLVRESDSPALVASVRGLRIDALEGELASLRKPQAPGPKPSSKGVSSCSSYNQRKSDRALTDALPLEAAKKAAERLQNQAEIERKNKGTF